MNSIRQHLIHPETCVCVEGNFQCSNAKCINETKICNKNRTDDCGDNSDEKFCSCQKNEFRCISDNSCILANFRCDHDKDCPDASDEMDCGNTGCSYIASSIQEPPIRCLHPTACIKQSWICDGQDDCWDNEDERNCCKWIIIIILTSIFFQD